MRRFIRRAVRSSPDIDDELRADAMIRGAEITGWIIIIIVLFLVQTVGCQYAYGMLDKDQEAEPTATSVSPQPSCEQQVFVEVHSCAPTIEFQSVPDEAVTEPATLTPIPTKPHAPSEITPISTSPPPLRYICYYGDTIDQDTTYVVRQNDTLSCIAARSQVPCHTLLNFNPQYSHNRDLIYPGNTLYIPRVEDSPNADEVIENCR